MIFFTHISHRSLALLAIQTARVYQKQRKTLQDYSPFFKKLEDCVLNNNSGDEKLSWDICQALSLSKQYAAYTVCQYLNKNKTKSLHRVAKDTINYCRLSQTTKNNLLTLHQTQKDWKPSYHTTNTTQLAKTIYETEDFTLTPILADALLDAGCENQLILNLLENNPNLFSRGSWCIQKLLNNSTSTRSYQ